MNNTMNQFADKLNPSSIKKGLEFIRQDYPSKQNERKVDRLEYCDWKGQKLAAYYVDGKLIIQDKEGKEPIREVASFEYFTHGGGRWRAGCDGNIFLHYQKTDERVHHTDTIIIYQGWDGRSYVARVAK